MSQKFHMGVTQEGTLDYDIAEKARQDFLEAIKRSYQLVPESSEFLTLSHMVASITPVLLRCATLNIANQNIRRARAMADKIVDDYFDDHERDIKQQALRAVRPPPQGPCSP